MIAIQNHIKMKLLLNSKESNSIWRALQFYVNETTHTYEDGDDKPGLPDGEERKLLNSVLNKLLIETNKQVTKRRKNT